MGNELAKQNDYSVLGKLMGLTQDQIDRLQGTGAYAPVHHEKPTRRPSPPHKTPGYSQAADDIWIRNDVNGTTSGGVDWNKVNRKPSKK